MVGYLPLAVDIVASRLRDRPQWSLGEIRRRLADSKRRLEELDTGGVASVRKVAEIFADGGPASLEALRQGLRAGAVADLRRVAHTLKGNARDVGAYRLANQCESLEEMARSGKLDQADPLVERISASWVQANQALQAHVSQRP